jgi:hypothetical protein
MRILEIDADLPNRGDGRCCVVTLNARRPSATNRTMSIESSGEIGGFDSAIRLVQTWYSEGRSAAHSEISIPAELASL